VEVDPRPGLRLLRDLVLVKPDPAKKILDLGAGRVLHVPFKHPPQRGTVLCCGPRVWNLEPGDRVLYGRTSWVHWIYLDEDERRMGFLFHERDILALITQEEGGDGDPVT
jgi:hypothetical protein